jgi:hypothetical protein
MPNTPRSSERAARPASAAFGLPALACCLLASAFMLSSCDYFEQGYYELAGSSADGATVQSFPFAVEEITDDSGITVGFRVLLPTGGKLVELPLVDGTDMTRRAWQIMLVDSDSAAGDLDLTLSHADERLSFDGAYLDPRVATGLALPFGGYVLSGDGPELSRLTFNGRMPVVAEAQASTPASNSAAAPAPAVVEWQVRRIQEAAFVKALGVPLAKAKRVAAAKREPLAVDESAAQADGASGWGSASTGEAASPDDEQGGTGQQDDKDDGAKKRKPRTPPLGGRSGGRPR